MRLHIQIQKKSWTKIRGDISSSNEAISLTLISPYGKVKLILKTFQTKTKGKKDNTMQIRWEKVNNIFMKWNNRERERERESE